jgi:hypothetical protein
MLWIAIIAIVIIMAIYFYIKSKHPGVIAKIKRWAFRPDVPGKSPHELGKPTKSSGPVSDKVKTLAVPTTDLKGITLKVELGNTIKTGSLSLVINVDWARACKKDRDFVNTIINQMQEHANPGIKIQPPSIVEGKGQEQ